MSTYKRWLPALVLCSSLGCTHQMAISNTGFVWQSTLADIRIGYKLGVAGDAQLEQGKDAISRQAAEMIEEVLPELVEAAVKAALASAGVGAVGSLLDACPAPLRDIITDGVGEEPGDHGPDEVQPEGRRRTPAEKAANRKLRQGGQP